MFRIHAVAIGAAYKHTFETRDDAELEKVRPYIKGLINWLIDQTEPPALDDDDDPPESYKIGKNEAFVIDYEQCEIDQLPKIFKVTADVIVCMSTSVAAAAADFTANNAPSKPIVAIVSDPYEFKDDVNVCGVSAIRHQLVHQCYKAFKKKKKVKTIYALHRDGYAPSIRATQWLGTKVIPVPVADLESIKTKIEQIKTGPKPGLLVLPADRFFGAGDDIVAWAEANNNMPTFWTTPDWPKTAAKKGGGYGFPQELCGQYMAERVAKVFQKNCGGVPEPRFVMIDPDHINWKPPAPRPVKKSKKSAKRAPIHRKSR